jgi:outer membrane protein assembly factor BamD
MKEAIDKVLIESSSVIRRYSLGGTLRRALLIIPLLFCFFAAPTSYAKSPSKTMSAQDRYEAGLRFMKRGYYTRALEELHRVRNYHRDSPYSVLAQLAIADLHYNKGDFDQARFAYEEFATYHPRHEQLHYVTYRRGLSVFRRAPKAAGRDQSSTRGAVNVWSGYSTRYPDSEHREEVERLLDTCRNRLAVKELWVARFYERREAWRAVRNRTETLLKRYPNSEHAPEAMSLLAIALHNWGNVIEAKNVREEFAEKFPESSLLSSLDRALTKPAGEPVPDALFVRPYRIRGAAGAGGGAGQ